MSKVSLLRPMALSVSLAAGFGLSSVAIGDDAAEFANAATQLASSPASVRSFSKQLAVAPAVASDNITKADVLAAQVAWGNALVQIAKDYEAGGISKAKATAEAVIDAAYGYQFGPVLFKPTLTTVPQTFRPTREGALSYFVGHNKAFPNDSGFALKGWRSVEITNSAIQLRGDTAMSIGNVAMTDKNGKVTIVDKTWGYARDAQGNLRIVLHHSSLPVARASAPDTPNLAMLNGS